MLNKTKPEIHNAVATDGLVKRVVTDLGAINQAAANAPQIDQTRSMQRRLRRERRIQRNSPTTLGLWHVSMW
jgi:hypothetical protein